MRVTKKSWRLISRKSSGSVEASLLLTAHTSMQAEGIGISAEIQFLSQQNLILSLENKALKQRFDSISHEHLIKCCKYLTTSCVHIMLV